MSHSLKGNLVKKIGVFFVIIMLVLANNGCEKKPTFKIVENRVIECCGVNDPIENLQWLNKIIVEIPSYAVFSAKLYVNSKDNSQFIVTKGPIFTNVYDCTGDLLFGGHYSGVMDYSNEKQKTQHISPVPCYKCEEFFKTHYFAGIIYERVLE